MDFLKDAVKKNDRYQKQYEKENVIDPKMIKIVEDFIIKKQLVCYGGIAINNILPKTEQFYDYDIDIPDYDFFSLDAMKDAQELCDIFAKEEFVYHVESKSAFFFGTYKVFVNFIPIADITQVHESFFKNVLKNSIIVDDIPYTNPDFLRMSLHQELSRPLGDVSRWEKIYTRMSILNKQFSISSSNNSNMIVDQGINTNVKDDYELVVDCLIQNNAIFNNMVAVKCLYKKYLSEKKSKNITCKRTNLRKRLSEDQSIVFVENFKALKKNLEALSIESLEIKTKKSIYKFVKGYHEIFIQNVFVCSIFELDSCMSYHKYENSNKHIKVGNLDTIFHIYFAIILMDDISINQQKIKKTISSLYDLITQYDKIVMKYIQNNPDKHKELIRFNLPCLGNQPGYVDILKERFKKFKDMKNDKNSKEYKKWFFKYIPNIKQDKTKTIRKSKSKLNKTSKNK